MALTPTLYYVLLGIATVTVAILVYYSWELGDGRRATILTALHVAIVVWCGGTLARATIASDAATARAITIPIGVAFVFVPAFWLVFVTEFSGYGEWLTRRTLGLVFLVPASVVPFVLTFPSHDLFYETLELSDTYYGVYTEFGPVFDLVFLYHVVAMSVATVFLGRMLLTRSSVYKRQAAILLFASFIPWVGGSAYVLGLVNGDLTPVGFAVTGVAVIYAVKYEGYVDIMPVARDTVMDRINNGVVVLDRDDRIIDINPRAREILGLADEAVVGEDLSDVLPDSVYDRYRGISSLDEEVGEEIEIETDAGVKYYQVLIAPLRDDRDYLLGRTMVVNDITEQKRREEKLRTREHQLEERRDELESQKDELERQKRKLEHQNERLDDFASIVSHDLRNPLNVAVGNMEMVAGELDGDASAHAETVEESLHRMSDIIDDALELARSGKAITETEHVDIAGVASDAWENVDTGDADLVLDLNGGVVVEADRDRSLSAFENLFRNSIEHGGRDVTVRVGAVDSGFYVEDDGEGIPEEERNEVLDRGYTTSDNGTGFGLSIVSDVVDAHGWDLEVDESDDGGARFVITRTA